MVGIGSLWPPSSGLRIRLFLVLSASLLAAGDGDVLAQRLKLPSSALIPSVHGKIWNFPSGSVPPPPPPPSIRSMTEKMVQPPPPSSRLRLTTQIRLSPTTTALLHVKPMSRGPISTTTPPSTTPTQSEELLQVQIENTPSSKVKMTSQSIIAALHRSSRCRPCTHRRFFYKIKHVAGNVQSQRHRALLFTSASHEATEAVSPGHHGVQPRRRRTLRQPRCRFEFGQRHVSVSHVACSTQFAYVSVVCVVFAHHFLHSLIECSCTGSLLV